MYVPLPVGRSLRGQMPITATRTTAARAQFDHGAHARLLPPPLVPVRRRERLELAQVADKVLRDDARAGEGPIEGHILRGLLLPAWLAAWRDHVAHSPVGPFAHERVVGGRARQHPRLARQRGVGHRCRYARRDPVHVAVVQGDHHLRLDGVRLLFARVGPIRLPVVLRALHPLRVAVYHARFVVQIRQLGVGVQGFGHPVALAARGWRLAHRVPAHPLEHRQHALGGPLGGGIGYPEEVAQRLLRDVVAQPDHREQDLLVCGQAAVLPLPLARPLPPRPLLRGIARLGQGRSGVPHQIFEQGYDQARHRLKDGRFPAQVGRAQQHRAVLQQLHPGGLLLAYPSRLL